MILYHIDRHNFIQPGQIVDKISDYEYCSYLKDFFLPNNNGLSMHGVSYLTTSFPFEDGSNKFCAIFELILEHVRILYFPHMPSRFKCFFACHPSDYKKWLSIFSNEDCNYPVFEIQSDNYIKLDAKFITTDIANMTTTTGTPIPDFPLSSDLSIIKLAYQAYFYWAGQVTNNPLFECLLVPPFKVLRRIL